MVERGCDNLAVVGSNQSMKASNFQHTTVRQSNLNPVSKVGASDCDGVFAACCMGRDPGEVWHGGVADAEVSGIKCSGC